MPALCRSSSFWPSPADLGDAEEQVLRRGVLVAEAAGLLLGAVDHALGARVEAERAALDAGPLGEDRGELAAECRQVDAEAPERLGGHAVIGLEERGQQVLGVEHGALEPLGEGLGGDDGLLGLLGEAIELHGLVLALAAAGQARGSGWSMRSARVSGRGLRLVAEIGREDDADPDEEVAGRRRP